MLVSHPQNASWRAIHSIFHFQRFCIILLFNHISLIWTPSLFILERRCGMRIIFIAKFNCNAVNTGIRIKSEGIYGNVKSAGLLFGRIISLIWNHSKFDACWGFDRMGGVGGFWWYERAGAYGSRRERRYSNFIDGGTGGGNDGEYYEPRAERMSGFSFQLDFLEHAEPRTL